MWCGSNALFCVVVSLRITSKMFSCEAKLSDSTVLEGSGILLTGTEVMLELGNFDLALSDTNLI